MYTSPPATPPLSRTSWGEWGMGVVIAAVALGVAMAVWAYSHWAEQKAERQARQAWLSVPKVLSQLADGRMVHVKVNLKLDNGSRIASLDGHQPALKAMIQSVGPSLSREDIKGPDGFERYSQTIRAALNGYLSDRGMDERVQEVAFEEFVLMP